MTNAESAAENTEASKNSATPTESKAENKAPTQPARTRPSVHKTDYENDTVYLYQFVRCPVVPSPSPFCLKVETWLRMTGVKYENVDHRLKYKSKKGQLPFVELNGTEIADSDIIISELSKKFDKDLDVDLSVDQKNVSHAFNSMLNNHTSWQTTFKAKPKRRISYCSRINKTYMGVMRWWRYNHPAQFLKVAQLDVKRALNSKLPKGILQFFFKMSFRSNVKKAIGHGLGRHSNEEILQFGKDDLKALSEYLQNKLFFFGDEPHLLDCVAFSHLCQFYYVSFGDIKEYMDTNCTNLVNFLERMKDRYWQDWEEMSKSLDLNTHLPKKEDEKGNKEVASEEKEGKKDLEGKEDEKLKDDKGEISEEKTKDESEKKE